MKWDMGIYEILLVSYGLFSDRYMDSHRHWKMKMHSFDNMEHENSNRKSIEFCKF